MNLAKLHMLLDQGLTVQINLTKLNDCDMIAAVNIIKTKEDAGKSISTRPFIMKGSPKEIEENLVPQLMLKESAILRTFKILDEDFDKSLKQIEKDGTAPATKTATSTAVKKAEPVKKLTPKETAQATIDNAVANLTNLRTYDEMKAVWMELKKNTGVAKLLPKEHAEALKTIRTAMIPLKGLTAPAQEKAPEKVVGAANPPEVDDEVETVDNTDADDEEDDELELGKGEDDPLLDDGEQQEEENQSENPDDPWL